MVLGLATVDLVIFAIQAAIKLGRKVRTVFEDEVRDGDLLLPPVEVLGSDIPLKLVSATNKFFLGDGKEYVKEGPPPGPYFALFQDRDKNRLELYEAYRRIKGLDEFGPEGLFRPSPVKDDEVSAFFTVQQWAAGTDPKPNPVMRLAGTVVELALDYVKVDPTLFGRNAPGERVLRSFLVSLDEVEFSEARFDDLLMDIFQAALGTFRTHTELLIPDDTLALLLKRLSTTLKKELEEAQASGDALKEIVFNTFSREMLQDVIRISAATVADQAPRFLGDEEQLLNGVLLAVLRTLQQQPKLSTTVLAEIYAASLRAVGQNSALILPPKNGNHGHEFLATLISSMAEQLADSASREPPGIFTPEVLGDVTGAALEVLTDNAPRLIKPEDPQHQVLVEALSRVIGGFSAEFNKDETLASTVASLFSQRQLESMVRVVFEAVAQNPEGLLQAVEDDPQGSALAQMVRAVAMTISQDTHRLINGEGYVKLLAVALQAFAKNPDRLLDIDKADLKQNILAQVMTDVLTAAAENLERRHLLTGEMLLDAMEAAMATVSQNIAGFQQDQKIVKKVLDRLLKTASRELANLMDADVLLAVFPLILRQALKDKAVIELSAPDFINLIEKAIS